MRYFLLTLGLFFFLKLGFTQIPPGPDRVIGEGPFDQLIIRGVTLINGNGAPPRGPVDIVIEKNKIVAISNVGFPGVPINPKQRPVLQEGGKEIDGEGMFVLPGLIDAHAHIDGKAQGTTADYVYKLWMGHGITTVRDVMARNGLIWTLKEKDRSRQNLIAAPRIYAYTGFGLDWDGTWLGIPSTIEETKAWVRENARRGADGIKFRWGAPPEIMKAALEENNKLGLRAAAHHDQMGVARWNVLHSARAGMTSMEHWYGLPEALFEDRTVQDYSLGFNYSNEQDRFGEAGALWKQAAKPGSEKWEAVMEELLELDFSLVPTFGIYEASRDLQQARRAEWHEEYTLPSLWRFYQPSKISHGSYWHYWNTEKEVNWRDNYNRWMVFVNEYKNRGGRVAAGSDSGFIFQLYGFGYIRELELLREAGFHPLEVIRTATLNAAEIIGIEDEVGTIEVGKLADLILIEENPLENLKVLYGTGAIKLNADNEIERVGGVHLTIKDGIIYDAKALLEDVRRMVRESKQSEDFKIQQPGVKRN